MKKESDNTQWCLEKKSEVKNILEINTFPIGLVLKELN